jgi:hypothetical protein
MAVTYGNHKVLKLGVQIEGYAILQGINLMMKMKIFVKFIGERCRKLVRGA